MKKMLKIAFSLLMTLVLAAGMCVSSVAGDAGINLTYKGEAGGGFEFKPGSGYTSTDLFDNFKNVMPGDELEQKVVFTNNDTQHDYVNLYMRAVPHGEENAPQAQVSAAESNEFLSKLEMWVYNGETEIYHASPDQPAQLASDVLLGSFFKGETATLTVKLKVPIELDNQYANRIGEVDWVFTVNAFSDDLMFVRKVWSDGSSNDHAKDVVKANLICDGKVVCTKELTKDNGWTETFSKLRDGGIDDLNIENHTWKIEEAEVPYDYTVSYSTDGNVTIITNTRNHHVYPDYDADITVNKKWSNDAGYKRPKYALATLYSGDKAIETVRLDASNGWSYSWKKLPAGGNWHVMESSVPAGYTPVYSATGDVVTITNTARLIQTGQLNWPVFALGAAGAILVILGGIVLLKKRKNA